jgi:hypothetical protein
MKLRFAFLTTILLVVFYSIGARAEGPKYRVASCQIFDFVGDIIARPDSLCEKFEKVLGRSYFLRYEGTRGRATEFNANGYYWVRNPFSKEYGSVGDTHEIKLQLEIENVYYGQNVENLGDVLIQLWLLGPLLTAIGNSGADPVVGMVQYRVKAQCDDIPGMVVGVGQGAVGGKIERLSRHDAISVAADRALAAAAFELIESMNKHWGLGASHGFNSADWEEYQEKAAAIVRANGE